jgi:hypothetical protein
MKLQIYIRRLGIVAVMFLSVVSASADPIEIPERPLTTQITVLISLSILLEAVCIFFILRRFRKPRLFVLWILGLHLITYPVFLGMLWLFKDMRPAFAVAIGEGSIVIIEGILIYLICRFISSIKSTFIEPSIIRCLLASLVGNTVSAAAFPVLLAIYEHLHLP